MKKKVVITGAAGFIGTHLRNELADKYTVLGIDSLNGDKPASKKRAAVFPGVIQASIHNDFISDLEETPDVVVHLAAETGIPGSLQHPELYFRQNVEGTFNVLEQCRKWGVNYLIYASSSSVYSPGQVIMKESEGYNEQLSFYGTSKRMTEVMVENYCRQFGMIAIGLRFFTVYGSWTRPDMAAYKFMDAIDKGRPVKLYNKGNVYRDFTHVSDIVLAIRLLMRKIEKERKGAHRVFNIGYGKPVSVKEYAETIARNLDRKLHFVSDQLPENELSSTHCDNSSLYEYIGFSPKCSIEYGIREMTDWFRALRYEE